jgi:DNA polymerase-4
VRKSIGAENTFLEDLFTYELARNALLPLIEKVWRYCETTGTRGRTVVLKIKYADFQQITRSHTEQGAVSSCAALEGAGYSLLAPLFPTAKGIRLLGISLTSLGDDDTENRGQLNLLI